MRTWLSTILAVALLCTAGCSEYAEESSSSEQNTPLVEAGLLNFVFSSGAGGWSTQMTLRPDGSFTGHYEDSDMGDTGEEYPGGTVYYCDFSGSFAPPERVDEYFWTMVLNYIQTNEEPGQEKLENGIRAVSTGPNGLEQVQEVWLYLPGAKTEELPEEFLSWAAAAFPGEMPDEFPYYGLYNVNEQSGFVGYPLEEAAQH